MKNYEKYIKELEKQKNIDELREESFLNQIIIAYCTKALHNILTSQDESLEKTKKSYEELLRKGEERYKIVVNALISVLSQENNDK